MFQGRIDALNVSPTSLKAGGSDVHHVVGLDNRMHHYEVKTVSENTK
jgi:hypothetical protein